MFFGLLGLSSSQGRALLFLRAENLSKFCSFQGLPPWNGIITALFGLSTSQGVALLFLRAENLSKYCSFQEGEPWKVCRLKFVVSQPGQTKRRSREGSRTRPPYAWKQKYNADNTSPGKRREVCFVMGVIRLMTSVFRKFLVKIFFIGVKCQKTRIFVQLVHV